MANHFHLAVSAAEDVLSADILGDFKSYASRPLNRRWGKPESGTWWTASGSRRPFPDEALHRVIRYILDQHGVLARWLNLIHGGIEDFLKANPKPHIPTERGA